MEEKCKWIVKQNPEYDDYYDTDCGHSFMFTDGLTPKQHEFEYCPFCGKKLSS